MFNRMGIDLASPDYELSLSDKDFAENYKQLNIRWWKDNIASHRRTHGGVICGNCTEKIISPDEMRPYGGINYCPPCFRGKALSQMKHHFSLDQSPPPGFIKTYEWMMRIARVMDGGLVQFAEDPTAYEVA